MELDLRLLPADNQSDDCNLSFDLLDMNRDSELFHLIVQQERLTGVPVRRGGIHSFSGRYPGYEETCYGKTEITPYGDRMKSILAKELIGAMNKYDLSDDWKNRAILAFLKQLPEELPIYLFWH